MKKLLAATAIALAISMPLYAEDATPQSSDFVIIKVNGDEIKKSEVEQVWKSIFPGANPPAFDTFEEKVKENVLRGVASEHIVMKEAEKSGIQNSPEVKDKIAAAEKQIIIQEFLKNKSKEFVTEEKLKAAYAEKTKTTGDEFKARHILVKTEEEAKEIEKKLKKGGDFDKIAKEKSQDKSSGQAGGELGWFTADKMVPEFSQAVIALKKDEVSAPVKTDFGWHIIKLEDRRKATPPKFEDIKEELAQEIGKKLVSDYINTLIKANKITVLDAKGNAKELSATPEVSEKK